MQHLQAWSVVVGESTGEGVSVPILTHDHELLVTESKNMTEVAKTSLSVCA